MANRETQIVTSDKSVIPSHYIPLSSYGCCAKDRPATPQYTALHNAWQKGELSGVKFMSTPTDFRGQIFIDPIKAEALLRKDAAKPNKTKPTPTPTFGVTGETASQFLVVFLRIAEALEAIATQPERGSHNKDINGDATDGR